MSERVPAKRKKLYELDPDTVINSLRQGKISGFSGEEDGGCDTINVNPALMQAELFLDLNHYLTVLVSQGYTVREGLKEEGKIDPTTPIVFEKIKPQ